jgi:hypothetical protein
MFMPSIFSKPGRSFHFVMYVIIFGKSVQEGGKKKESKDASLTAFSPLKTNN